MYIIRNHPVYILWIILLVRGPRLHEGGFFSCEDAAQQVLMSSVCPSVCLSSMLKFFQCVQIYTVLECSRSYQNVPEYSFPNVPECSRMHAECSRMHSKYIQNVPECFKMFQNVSECPRVHAECSRMTAECFRRHSECSRMHAECSRMHAESSIMLQNACRKF